MNAFLGYNNIIRVLVARDKARLHGLMRFIMQGFNRLTRTLVITL